MGGTLASLRGFIEGKGGRVIGMTTLASFGGACVPIALAESTLSGLNAALDGQLPELCRVEVGHDVSCLTEPEGNFLLGRCTSYDQFRAGIDGARNG
jgi:hypothetical protein